MRPTGENIKININNLEISYDDNGPVYAPAVIFIHGFPFTKRMWDMQAEALKNNYRVIAYDLRGYGNTRGPKGEYTFDVLTEDLINLMDQLHIKKAILCGISIGGYIALNAVQKYPGRFNALVLCGTQCPADSEEQREERLYMIDHIMETGIDEYVDESMKHLFASGSFSTRKEEVREVRNMITGCSVESVCDTLRALANRKDTCSGLPAIKIPVLILAGKEDNITPVSTARQLRDNIPGAELKVIDYAGHLANLENTHEFNEALKNFVNLVCEMKHLSRHCSEPG